jgi:hypothetical protein
MGPLCCEICYSERLLWDYNGSAACRQGDDPLDFHLEDELLDADDSLTVLVYISTVYCVYQFVVKLIIYIISTALLQDTIWILQ